MAMTPVLHPRDLVALQRAAGNQTVSRLLTPRAPERTSTSAPAGATVTIRPAAPSPDGAHS